MIFFVIKMPSDDEFDYMSDNFLAEWLVLNGITPRLSESLYKSFVRKCVTEWVAKYTRM